jgi:hypothetical protein
MCADFLPNLGQDQRRPRRPEAISPARALALVALRLREPLSECDRLWLCLPGYLSEPQAMECGAALAKTRLRILGVIPSAVALAMAARAESEERTFVTVEVDSHCLTFGRVEASEDGLRLAEHHVALGLGMNAWWEAMLNGIAEICIRQNRRDFRDCGTAEQGIFGQLDDVVSAASRGELIEIVIRTKQWCQNLILRPEQINAMCAPVALCGANALAEWLEEKALRSNSVILSDDAASRPGLKTAIEEAAKGMEVMEINTVKALGRVHAQATQWAGLDPGKTWRCLPRPAARSPSTNNERLRSLRLRWR